MMEPSPALTAVMHSGVCSSRIRRLRMAAAYTSLFSHLQGQRSGMREEHLEEPSCPTPCYTWKGFMERSQSGIIQKQQYTLCILMLPTVLSLPPLLPPAHPSQLAAPTAGTSPGSLSLTEANSTNDPKFCHFSQSKAFPDHCYKNTSREAVLGERFQRCSVPHPAWKAAPYPTGMCLPLGHSSTSSPVRLR